MASALSSAVPLLLLLLLLLPQPLPAAGGQSAGPSLNCGAVRKVVSSAMRCYGYRLLQLAALQPDVTHCVLKLQLLPNGSVVDAADVPPMFIASVSKGMFATALTSIDTKVKLERNFSLFTTPLKMLYGDNFWFLNHKQSDLVTVNDLVSHSTGLARYDTMWFMEGFRTKEEIFKHTARLKPRTGFRASFLYNNLVWTVADLSVQKLVQQNFSSYMRSNLWRPLGMSDTYGSSELPAALRRSADADAQFYVSRGFPFETDIPMSGTDVVEAAGGIVTTLEDMMKYMKRHAQVKYSIFGAPPAHWTPLNPSFATQGYNQVVNPGYFKATVKDLPDFQYESYAAGWMRGWYRNRLLYSHSGSLVGLRCELDVYPQLNLAFFNHVSLGASATPTAQSLFTSLINKYVADLLLRNASFVTEANVCNLYRDLDPKQPLVPIQRGNISADELQSMVGSYGNFGFGTVVAFVNATTQLLNVRYGISQLELHPVQRQPAQQGQFEFLTEVLEPPMFRSANIANQTAAAIFVPQSVAFNEASFLQIHQLQSKQVMTANALEAGMQLQKGLDPNSWTRPTLCPNPPQPPSPTPKGGSKCWGSGCVLLLLQVLLLLLLSDSEFTRLL